MPVHSVECERVFSLLKVIKTDWRNRLLDTAVTDLIRISLDAADIKNFNPDPAIHLWQQAAIRGRRLNQKIWKKTKQSRHSGLTESDSDATSDISENRESDSEYSSNESSISPPAVESDAMPDIDILNETEQHLVNSEFHHSHAIIMISESEESEFGFEGF